MISFIVPFRSNGDENRERSFKAVHDSLVRDWPDDEVLVVDYQGSDLFSRSAARNLGADVAKGDPLVFVDADSWVAAAQIDLAIRWVLTLPAEWAFPYNVYYSLSRSGTEMFFSGSEHPHFDYVFPGPDPIDRPAAVGGCVVVSRKAFEKVHGYDERFIGWGEEDRAFALALGTLVGDAPRVGGPIYHLWHTEPEEDRFGQPYFEHNRALCNQYREVAGDPDGMRKLICER